MSKTVCSTPGCPADAVRRGLCTDHARQRDRERGSREARGYGPDHQRQRTTWQQRMDAGHTVLCWRCGEPIDPSAWHLGHDDHDRSITHGPEHARCNLSAAGKASHL